MNKLAALLAFATGLGYAVAIRVGIVVASVVGGMVAVMVWDGVVK